jgi:uncharacterized protein YdaU (DUF1376 family)
MSDPLGKWLPLDVAEFNLLERQIGDRALAAYARFIVHAWGSHGKLPADTATLSRIARAPESVWRAALNPFEFDGAEWVHPGLTAQLEKARSISAKRQGAANSRHHPAPANVTPLKSK